MKGNVEVTNTGDFISVSKGNNVTSAQGQGVITTKDGSEKANYTCLAVGKVTEEGKPVLGHDTYVIWIYLSLNDD
jgi:hypothetical protein